MTMNYKTFALSMLLASAGFGLSTYKLGVEHGRESASGHSLAQDPKPARLGWGLIEDTNGVLHCPVNQVTNEWAALYLRVHRVILEPPFTNPAGFGVDVEDSAYVIEPRRLTFTNNTFWLPDNAQAQ